MKKDRNMFFICLWKSKFKRWMEEGTDLGSCIVVYYIIIGCALTSSFVTVQLCFSYSHIQVKYILRSIFRKMNF